MKSLGKPKGKFLVACSQGSKANGQQPSMRVRLAGGTTVIAHVEGRSNIAGYMRRNPMSAERKSLEQQMLAYGFTMQDVLTVLSE